LPQQQPAVLGIALRVLFLGTAGGERGANQNYA
jgi:hypothetical protein